MYKELRVSVRHRRRGARRWLTLHELTLKYGSERVARRIAEHKLADAELARTQVRFHPDAPGDEVPVFALIDDRAVMVTIDIYIYI